MLLLDEPASGLDPRARVEMRELLRELRKMGKTIVLSSHILTELAELCDSIGIIERGRLVVSGTMDEIRRQIGNKQTLQIRLLSDMTKAEAILAAHPAVQQIYPYEAHPETIELHFTGTDADAADLLETLISAGVRVSHFAEATTGLEEIFLHLTKGEVA